MESMDEIYRKYARTVYRYLMSLSGSPEVAEEVTQETFYQAVKNINRFDGSCRITTWLCAIAKNQLAVYYRKHPAAEPLEHPDGEGGIISVMDGENHASSAEQDVLEEMSRMDLLQQMHRLTEPYREVMYLRTFGGLAFREIGQIFGKTENWARVTFYRSKEQLRKEMEKE